MRDRIRRPNGDPEKIANRTPIIEAFNAGKLTPADYELLERQLAESRTPDGAALAKSRQDFLEESKSKTGPSVSSDAEHADPAAVARLYDVEREIDRKVERARKDGKDPSDLFDPTKPEFLGRPGALQAFSKVSPSEPTPGAGGTNTTSPEPGAVPSSQRSASAPTSNSTSGAPPSPVTTTPDATHGDVVDRHVAPEPANDLNTAAPHHAIADALEAAAQRLRRSVQHRQEPSEFKPTEVPADGQSGARASREGPVEPDDARQPNPEPPSDQPSISEHATNALRDAFVAAGLKADHAGYLAEGLVDVLSTFTPLGIPLAVDDMQRAARRGDWIGTIAAAATLVPGGRIVKLGLEVRKGALALTGAGAHAKNGGRFSIGNWPGYLNTLPKPKGPFRLVKGQEYDSARRRARAFPD